MGDDGCKEICEGIIMSGNLKVLNISKCNITCIGSAYISDLLLSPDCPIVSLIMHWNKIRGKGSILLAKAIKKN